MTGLLAGTRVFDLSDSLAGAFATRWFALLGADVIKVEPPEGDPSRCRGPRKPDTAEGSALFAYLNGGKRSVVLDTQDAAGVERLNRLLATADVIVETAAPGAWGARGIDFTALRRVRPSMVVCSVTPFGQTGPRARWRAGALTAFAAGGQLMMCGDPDREPLKTAGHQAHYQGALHVFSATAAALFAAQRDGAGDHIDISLQEAQAASLEGAGPNSMVREVDAGRSGNQMRAVWGIYPCADGFVGVAAMARQTPSVYRCIGHPELIESPIFSDLAGHPEGNEVVSALITEWASTRTSQEIFEESHSHRAPFSIIPTPAALLDWGPLREAGFWQPLDHPVLGPHTVPLLPFAIDGDRGLTTRAPLLGEHTTEVLNELSTTTASSPRRIAVTAGETPLDPRAPYAGLHVLDLTQVWAGPYAARFLADMGANVIHIEGPAFPDAVRGIGRGTDDRWFNKAPYFNDYNRNKRGLALELHREEGLAVFRRLVQTADVVIENWSVGVAERLGIGYEALRAIKPDIIMVQMPGFAQEPPESERVGFGPTIEQMGGLVALQGYEGGEPHKSGISYGDPTSGITTAGAIGFALLRRSRTGQGAHVVVTQRNNIINLVGEFIVAESAGLPYLVRAGNRDTDAVPHNVYRTRDDRVPRPQADVSGRHIGVFADTWIAIAIDSDEAWAALCAAVADPRLDRSEWTRADGRREAEAEIDAILAEWARQQDAEEIAGALQPRGVDACPVFSPLGLVRDPHLADRGYYEYTMHPDAGRHRTTRPVWRMTARPTPPPRPAPCFGEHNHELLREAGYSDSEIADLEAAGILASEPREA